MKRKDIFDFIDELERTDDTFRKWGDLYSIEANLIDSIIQIRKEKGLTQSDLARMTNLKQPAIARIETKANSPQLDTLIKLVDALDLKIELVASDCSKTLEKIYENAFNEVHLFYSQTNNEAVDYYSVNDEGESLNESKPQGYPCKEHLLA